MKGTLACGFLASLLCWNTLLQGASGRDSIAKYHDIDASVSTLQTSRDFKFYLQAVDVRYGLHTDIGRKGFRLGGQAGLSGYFFQFDDILSGHNRVFRDIRDREFFLLLAPKLGYHTSRPRTDFFVEAGIAGNLPLYALEKRVSVNPLTNEETPQQIKYNPKPFLLPEVSLGIRLPERWFHLGAKMTYGYDFRPYDGADNYKIYSTVKLGLSLQLGK